MPGIFKLVGALVLVFTLAGCVQEMQQFNRDLAAANAAMAGGQPGNAAKYGTMARMPETGKEQPMQLIVPADTHTREAMDEALPTIKKVLSIHQCVKEDDGLMQLNYWAVPGVSFRGGMMGGGFFHPNSQYFMKYHDRNKCVSVRAIDSWAMPALNALRFRAVYFAEDSGETVNFSYLMKKMDDGSWKLQKLERT